jgi:hypothetical protein
MFYVFCILLFYVDMHMNSFGIFKYRVVLVTRHGFWIENGIYLIHVTRNCG